MRIFYARASTADQKRGLAGQIERADNASGDGSGYASTGSTYGIANTVVADG